MRHWSYCFLFFVALWLYSCGSGENSLTNNTTGRAGEILVVSPVDISRTALKDTLEAILRSEYPYIPQSEPSFTTIYVTDRAFGHVLMPFRNILMVRFHSDSVHPSLRREADRWAKGQQIVYLTGRDQRSVATFLSAHREQFYQLFEQIECSRLQEANRKILESLISDSIAKLFGVELEIPKGYLLRRAARDFRWYSIETPDISQGLLIYKTPHTTGIWRGDTLVARRNRFTREYVPGPTKGTYMEVADVVPPSVALSVQAGDTIAYLRGFWEVHGHAMGGSYISYSHLNKRGDSLITTEGYIYAPRFAKRDYMRALDAILLTQFRKER
ncbi:MAG: DUF4837 family protein [Bacteroides sp.]